MILIAETHYAGGKHDKAEETVKEGIDLAAECGDQRKESRTENGSAFRLDFIHLDSI